MLTSLFDIKLFINRGNTHSYVNDCKTLHTTRVVKESRDTIIITTNTVWFDPNTKRRRKKITQEIYRVK